MSMITLQQTILRTVGALVLTLMLAISGWYYLHPQLAIDQSGHAAPSGPLLAEGHEGSFGG